MKTENLEKLEKKELIEIIKEHYNTLKKVGNDHKINADKHEDDDFFWAADHSYYSACETYANRLRNNVLFYTLKKDQL